MSGEQQVRGSAAVERAGGPAKGAGHGGPASGYSWPPFEPGHTLSTKHGAYATLQLKPRAQEIAGWLAEQMGDSFEPKFSAAIEAAALAAARVERALAHLDDHDEATIEEQFSRLDDRARGWLRLYLATLERLGLTPQQGQDTTVLPTTFVVVSAFGDARPRADVEVVDAAEVRELVEAGDPAREVDEDSPYAKQLPAPEHTTDDPGKTP